MPTLLRRGQVTVENLGGETRTLVFKSKTFAIVEEELGEGITEITSEKKIGVRTIGYLIWAACVHADDKLTPDEVFEWLDEVDDLAALMSTVMPAMQEGMPGGKKLFAAREKEESGKAKTKSA